MIKLFLFLFLINKSQSFVNIDENLPTTLGSPPVKGSGMIMCNYVLLYASIVAYAIAFLASFCVCEPDYAMDPELPLIIIHFIAATLLLLSAILGYAGCSKLTISTSNGFNNYLSEINNIIQNPFQNDINNAIKLYENISTNDYISTTNIKYLSKIVFDYNSTFTNKSSQYRQSFNDIYLNPDTSNYLKFSFKEMDESRDTILSQIYQFCHKYIEFSQSIKSTLQSMKENYFKSSEDLGTLIEKRLNKTTQNLGGYIYRDMFSDAFSYALSSAIILLAIVYSIAFFFANGFTRCCFCIYPVFALAITCCTFGTGYYFTKSNYNSIASCGYRSTSLFEEYNHEINQLIKDIRNGIINFNIDEGLNEHFNDIDRDEIENLYQSINSDLIHKNYKEIFRQYASDIEYRQNLVQMVRIITNKEDSLNKMRFIIKDVSNFSYSVYPELKEIHDKIEKLNETSLNDYIINKVPNLMSYKTCDDGINGANSFLAGTFLLFVGLGIMLVTVCLRRKDMEDYGGVTNSSSNNNNTSNSNNNDTTRKNVEESVIAYVPLYVMFQGQVSRIANEFNACPNKPDIQTIFNSCPNLVIGDTTFYVNGYYTANNISGYLFLEDRDQAAALIKAFHTDRNDADEHIVLIKCSVVRKCVIIDGGLTFSVVTDTSTVSIMSIEPYMGWYIG